MPRLLEGMSWASDAAETVTLSEIVTSPDILDAEINSVKFEQSGLGSERVPLGGTHVLLWKPSGGVDDASFEELPGPLVFEGMLEEIGNLERCRTGRVLSEVELQTIKEKHPRLRILSHHVGFVPVNRRNGYEADWWPRTWLLDQLGNKATARQLPAMMP